MDFRLLGSLEVSDRGRTLPLGGRKQRAVLARLLLRANQVVSPEDLIDTIWADEPPETARNTLQTYVLRLRKVLGADRIRYRSSGYVLIAGPAEVDALRFVDLLDRARSLTSTDPGGAVETLRQALGLWSGGALDDLADLPSLQPEIARLEELRSAAIEQRIDAELNLGRHAELVPELEALVRTHPLREGLWAHLMTAQYLSGRQADALAAFGRARDVLIEELGIDPSPELRRLQERILRQDPSLLVVGGQPLRGYRLLERLGAGSFGSVHRAFQPQVGREVAIKTIHPRFANDPEFIRRFEAEAQLIARLEHPHVVPLYDFWRDPEGAYLVMRFLRGGSLRQRLVDGPLRLEDVTRLVDQLALALSAAHRQGVVHRDVKPGNVLFDEDGNAYLSDFGIAKDLGAAEVVSGTGSSPLAYYLSPEEIKGEAVTPRADVHGLGLLLFEAFTGRHPFADTPPDEVIEKLLREPVPSLGALRPDLPAGIEEVIDRATAKDPAQRYPDATALAAALRETLAEPARHIPGRVEPRNPYKGLRPFQEPDAPDFFGREELIGRLVGRMAEHMDGARFLGVVGPSGSGKSSVVGAGLLPALRRGALPGSERWFVAQMHPGAAPFDELAAALVRLAVGPSPDLRERLEDERGLLGVAEELLPDDGAELLVVIDQFEELFTLVPAEDVRSRFLAALTAAATDRRSRIRVVVTLRADFFDRPLSYPGFGDLLATRTEAIRPMSVDELERTIVGPAERVGAGIDPLLLAEIVADVNAQPGALPLLQYALTELFEQRVDGTLTPNAYREIGGVSGALARRAEDLYGRLNQAGRQAARQLFLRLVTLGEEGSEDTRRRVLRAELTALELDPEAVDAVIDGFGARRLLSFDRDPPTRGPTVEVAHEALLQEWSRLRGWVEAGREVVRIHRRLAGAATEWADAGRDLSFLLRGDRLDRFGSWAAASGLALTADERAYLEASLAQREAERAEEESRRAREAALERRSLVRLRALVAVFAALGLVAGGLTALTLAQRERAEREARLATARELAAAAVANLDVDPERSILLALEAVDVTWEVGGTVVREAEEALHRALKRSRIVLTVPGSGGLAVSPDGGRFATTGPDGTATVWETTTGERVMTLRGHDGSVNGIAFSPDGSRLATTGADGTVRLWDGATGRQVDVLRGHRGAAWSPAFSPGGRWLATTGEDATVRLWDVATGKPEQVLTGPEDETFGGLFLPVAPEFTPDGSLLAAPRWDRTARIWDPVTGETEMVLGEHLWEVRDVAFSPDGDRVATASMDGTGRIWDARSGRHLTTFSGHTGEVHAVDYSPDGTRIATGGSDATARVWDAATGKQLLTLAGHTVGVAHVAFSPDGDRLLTSGLDGTTRLWDVSVGGGRDWLTVPGPDRRLGGFAFGPHGRTFAVPGDLAGVIVRDARTGSPLLDLGGHDARVTDVAFSPDGTRLAAAAGSGEPPARPADSTVPIWDLASGELVMNLIGHEDQVNAVAFTPDGRRLATSSYDGTVRVWDAATGEQIRTLEVGGPAYALGFSPDGRWLVAGLGGVERVLGVWEADTFELRRELSGHTDAIQDVAFGTDEWVVTGSWDATAGIWDLRSGRELTTLRGHTGAVLGVAVSPDGGTVATGSFDGTAKLWDRATGQEMLTLFGHTSGVDVVAFSPDGRLLATASVDGTVALHLLPIDELRELGRQRVTRSLTDEECRQYLRLETCPAA